MLCSSKETKVRKEERTDNFPDSGPSRTKTVISFNAALRKYWSHENIALMDDEMGEEDDSFMIKTKSKFWDFSR